MIKGRYIGPRSELKGKTALLRAGSRLRDYLVQFDDMNLTSGEDEHTVFLGFGWHSFPMNDWEISNSCENPVCK